MIGPYLLQDGTPGGVVAFYYGLFCLPHANNPHSVGFLCYSQP